MGQSRKSTQLLSYFAGIFDGEGTVGAYHVRRDVTLRLAIAMTEPTAILLLCREFPEAKLTKRFLEKKNGKPQFVATIHGLGAYEFLKAIQPYVIIKWEQVKVALTFLSHKRQTAHSKKHYPCSHCEWAVNTMMALKTPDSNGVKTVELLRSNGLRQYRAKLEDVEQDCISIDANLKSLQERVETRLSQSIGNKTISAPEKDIVQSSVVIH